MVYFIYSLILYEKPYGLWVFDAVYGCFFLSFFSGLSIFCPILGIRTGPRSFGVMERTSIDFFLSNIEGLTLKNRNGIGDIWLDRNERKGQSIIGEVPTEPNRKGDHSCDITILSSQFKREI
jgi:hypothetical protein